MAPSIDRRWIRRRMALPAVLAAAAIACSSVNHIEGGIAAADGATGLNCAVSRRRAESQSADWDRCVVVNPPAGFVDYGVVPLGGNFRCQVSANVDRVHAVEVQCPGYQRRVVEVLVENCAGFFSSCNPAQTGTIVVQR